MAHLGGAYQSRKAGESWSMVQSLISYVKMACAVILVWIGIWVYGRYGCSQAPGSEMSPTHAAGAFLTIDREVHAPGSLQRGDVVMFEREGEGLGQHRFLGRITGLPGERVRVVNDKIWVEEREISAENASVFLGLSRSWEAVLPCDSYFILSGDARSGAKFDSRSLGPISRGAIVGKVR